MHIQLIINGKTDQAASSAMARQLALRLPGARIDIDTASARGHATEIARRAAHNGSHIVVAVGGDGTVNEVANGIVGTPVALGVVPAGSANDLARAHGIPMSITSALDTVADQCTRDVDLIAVNGTRYLAGGGVGLPPVMAQMADSLRSDKIIGPLIGLMPKGAVYPLTLPSALIKQMRRPLQLEIRCNGECITARALALLINNQPALGRYFTPSPGALFSDGMFDVCLVTNGRGSWDAATTVLRTFNGSHIQSASVVTWRATELQVKADEPVSFMHDGETSVPSSHFLVQIHPRALKLIVPETGMSGHE